MYISAQIMKAQAGCYAGPTCISHCPYLIGATSLMCTCRCRPGPERRPRNWHLQGRPALPRGEREPRVPNRPQLLGTLHLQRRLPECRPHVQTRRYLRRRQRPHPLLRRLSGRFGPEQVLGARSCRPVRSCGATRMHRQRATCMSSAVSRLLFCYVSMYLLPPPSRRAVLRDSMRGQLTSPRSTFAG